MRGLESVCVGWTYSLEKNIDDRDVRIEFHKILKFANRSQKIELLLLLTICV
jgi:hypothetical protein